MLGEMGRIVRLGIDIDGILSDFNAAFVEKMVEVTGEDKFGARPVVPTSWKYPTEQFGYSVTQMTDTWSAVQRDPQFWSDLPKYPWTDAAMTALGALWQDNHDIYFITDRKGINPKNQTEVWLDQFGTVAPTVLISAEKGMCARALNLDLYIDDKNENCIAVRDQSPKTICVMLAQPWNEKIDGVARIDTMDEFFRVIEEATDAART